LAIDDDIGPLLGLESHVSQIAAGGLKAVEHEAGHLVIHLAAGQDLQHLHDRDLDRVGIL